MNQSNNAQDGALTFNLKVTKTEEGKTTVSCPAQPQLPPVTAERHSTAVELMKQRIQKAAAKPGGLKGQ